MPVIKSGHDSRRKYPVGADGFNTRERELLVLLSKGFHIPEVATRMGVNRHTLAENLKNIFKKTGASTQAEAVYRAVKDGVIP